MIAHEQSSWLKSWSNDEIREKQKNDPVLGKIIELKNENSDPPDKSILKNAEMEFVLLCQGWNCLQVHDGILYRKYTSYDSDEPVSLQIILPKEMRMELLRLLHSHKSAAHRGIQTTYHKVRANFYWPNYKQDIINWCTKCKNCETVNAKLNPKRAPLQSKPPLRRMETVSIDILKVPESEDGYNSIMVASDLFTKCSEFYAMRENTAQTCADLLCTQFFPRFGYPINLHSDGGKNFESDLFKEMCSILDIHKSVTPRYRPQHNAVIERNNRTLIKMLKSVVQDNPKSWPDYLPFCMEAFNSSVHSATGFTPNRLMFGTENRLPVHLMYGKAILET